MSFDFIVREQWITGMITDDAYLKYIRNRDARRLAESEARRKKEEKRRRERRKHE